MVAKLITEGLLGFLKLISLDYFKDFHLLLRHPKISFTTYRGLAATNLNIVSQ